MDTLIRNVTRVTAKENRSALGDWGSLIIEDQRGNTVYVQLDSPHLAQAMADAFNSQQVMEAAE